MRIVLGVGIFNSINLAVWVRFLLKQSIHRHTKISPSLLER
jgi:hypothetical protein